MSDSGRGERARETSLGEMIDLAGRRIMTGLIVAGLAIGIGLYSQPGPAKYQIVATGAGIARLNTRNGYVTSCEGGHCYRTLRPGSQDIEPRPKAPEVPAPAARPALPSPTQSPSAPAAQPDAATPAQPAPANR